MIQEKLSIQQQNEILQPLFGFEFHNTGENHWVLYDEEGEQFYVFNENSQFDFSTFAGIFSYCAHRAKNQGYSDCQHDFRKLLNLA